MKEYLFLFTITPVQGFIEQSRKSQDLYASSALLSFLCRQAALIVQKEWKGEIVFPDINLRSLPNRFLAIVQSDDENGLKEKGRELEQRIYTKLAEVFDYFFEFYKLPQPPEAWRQIRNYFFIYWVFRPNDNGYAETFRKIENDLGQIKIRTFSPFDEEGGRKCTLMGEHNALFYRRNNEGTKPKHLVDKATELGGGIPLKYLSYGEALGAVGFLKRVAPKYFEDRKVESSPFGSSFPSTARITLAEFLRRLSQDHPELTDLLKQDFNEVLLYELFYDNEPTEYETEEELMVAKQIVEVIKSDKKKYPRLPSYYAIVVFDGDDMGEWLSGEKLVPDKKEELIEFHRHLSKELTEFARIAAEKIVIPPKGATVYAGGDDFLGFVNLSYLPLVLKELTEEFSIINLSKFTAEKLTISIGVAIGHYKTPLSEVLQWARRMEKEAKSMSGKNAISIAVLKRSGEIVNFKTKLAGSNGGFADQLQFLLNELDKDFTTNFINQFCTEFIPFEGNMEIANLDGMIDSELGRLLSRSQSSLLSSSEKEAKEQIITQMKKVLTGFYIENNLTDFLGLLETLSFLTREMKAHAAKM